MHYIWQTFAIGNTARKVFCAPMKQNLKCSGKILRTMYYGTKKTVYLHQNIILKLMFGGWSCIPNISWLSLLSQAVDYEPRTLKEMYTVTQNILQDHFRVCLGHLKLGRCWVMQQRINTKKQSKSTSKFNSVLFSFIYLVSIYNESSLGTKSIQKQKICLSLLVHTARF